MAYSTDCERLLALTHEMEHIERAGLYDESTPEWERKRIEFQAHKGTVEKLVCFDKYREVLLLGFFDSDEQALKWGIPEFYVKTVHEIYNRIRYEDVQNLRSELNEKFSFISTA